MAHLARRIEGAMYSDRGSISFKGFSDPVVVIRIVPEGVDPVERLRPYAPAPPSSPSRTSRRWVVAGVVAVVLALVAVSIPLLSSSDDVDIGTNSVARMNAEDGSLEGATELGQRPGASAIGFESLWVAQPDNGRVARLDLANGSIVDTVPVGTSPAGIAVGMGSVWVTNAGDGTVSRIDPETNEVSQTIREVGTGPSGIAVGDGALWVADTFGAALLRVDPSSDESAQVVGLAGQPSDVAFTANGVWVSFAPAGIARVDPSNRSVTFTQSVGSGPKAVLSAFGSIWVANHSDGTVSRLEPSTARVEATEPVGDGPNSLGAAAGSIWVANEFDDSITAIDPTTDTVEQTVSVGGAAASIATDGDGLWLAVGASAAEHRGGTLTVSSADVAPISLDPAVVVYNDTMEGQILAITNDGLLSYDKVGGPGGATLVPDLASALPDVSINGLTYRFPLREGILYSTGEPVRPEDFRHALERAATAGGPAADSQLFTAIDGVEACIEEPSTCDLSGSIVADAEAVTFHLVRPDPDLPFKLALPAAYPVPIEIPTEDQGLEPVPATGPYMIAEAGTDGVELVRNPVFREWSGAAQPDGFVDAISWRFGQDPAKAFDRLSAGDLDWMIDGPEAEDLALLEAEHPDQVADWPFASTTWFGFNVLTPPFDDVRVRRALNYAIDRVHMVDLRGGEAGYRPTCQVLPPNLQGYEPFCPYTLYPDSGAWSAPDLDRARALIEDAGAVGEKVAVWLADDPETPAGFAEISRYIVEVLNELGLRADLKVVDTVEEWFDGVLGGEAQAYPGGWGSNYPTASDFINPEGWCEGWGNYSGLCTESPNALVKDALRLQATQPAAANSAWMEIEHQLVEEAVVAPVDNPVSTFAFSARVGNVQVHPRWGILVSRLWVQ